MAASCNKWSPLRRLQRPRRRSRAPVPLPQARSPALINEPHEVCIWGPLFTSAGSSRTNTRAPTVYTHMHKRIRQHKQKHATTHICPHRKMVIKRRKWRKTFAVWNPRQKILATEESWAVPRPALQLPARPRASPPSRSFRRHELWHINPNSLLMTRKKLISN